MTNYQLLPPLSEADYDALRDDIRTHGVLQAIDVDENGVILDGHHRQQIASELRITCPRRIVKGLHNETSKRTYALTVNTNRRQLTQEQRRHLVENSLRLDPQLADRDHARRIGISPSTVGVARERLASSGQVPRLDTRTDARGRQQPASKPLVSRSDTSERSESAPSLAVAASARVVPVAFTPPPVMTDEPDPATLVAEAIDKFLPPDPEEDARAARDAFLDALKACGAVTQFPVATLAALLDEDCVKQLALTVESLQRFQGNVLAARAGSGAAGNVLFLRPKVAS